MSTGIEAWKNLAEIGPIYPFVGAEFALVVVESVAGEVEVLERFAQV